MPAAHRKIPIILIVDDEALIRWSLAESLAEAGYRIVEAATADEAIRRVDENAGIALILLDLRMPDSADLRLFKVLRQRLPSIPIVVMTAFGTAEIEQEARADGALEVVRKPFDIPAMVRLAERVAPAHPM